MTTFTTSDREEAEREPVPFFGWIDKEDTEMILRQQLRVMQTEIEALKAKLKQYHLKEDLDRNLNLIYGKEFIK